MCLISAVSFDRLKDLICHKLKTLSTKLHLNIQHLSAVTELSSNISSLEFKASNDKINLISDFYCAFECSTNYFHDVQIQITIDANVWFIGIITSTHSRAPLSPFYARLLRFISASYHQNVVSSLWIAKDLIRCSKFKHIGGLNQKMIFAADYKTAQMWNLSENDSLAAPLLASDTWCPDPTSF